MSDSEIGLGLYRAEENLVDGATDDAPAMRRLIQCPECSGSGRQECGSCGAEDMELCEYCDGSGVIEASTDV